MNHSNRVFCPSMVIALLLLLLGLPMVSYAKQGGSSVDDLIFDIARGVIGRAHDAADEALRRNTGINPMERGYDRRRKYAPVPQNISEETLRELQKLNEEHDWKIAKLYEELQHKLDKAQDEFLREHAKEDKQEKVGEKRGKLQEKVDKAYATFEEKVAEENKRFDGKRDKILGH